MKHLYTSTLTFDIIQFFSFLNHQLLSMILTKVDFDSKIFWFFSDYLINRQTQYVWNYFTSPFFRADIDVGQRSTLSFILSAFYIASIFYILEKRTKNLSISILIFFLLLFLTMVFVFLRKKISKNRTQIFFVVIVLFFLFSDNSDLSLSIISLRFFISPNLQRTLILLL